MKYLFNILESFLFFLSPALAITSESVFTVGIFCSGEDKVLQLSKFESLLGCLIRTIQGYVELFYFAPRTSRRHPQCYIRKRTP